MMFPDCPYRNPEALGKCQVTNKRCSREPARCMNMLTMWRCYARGDYGINNKKLFRRHIAEVKKWIP